MRTHYYVPAILAVLAAFSVGFWRGFTRPTRIHPSDSPTIELAGLAANPGTTQFNVEEATTKELGAIRTQFLTRLTDCFAQRPGAGPVQESHIRGLVRVQRELDRRADLP